MVTSHQSEGDQKDQYPAEQDLTASQSEASPDFPPGPMVPTRDEVLILDNDLLTPDASEDDIPPPAYGNSYGEIHAEKDGLATGASVADDGRVNIRINQLNRRLSQIFTPALSQQLRGVEDDRSPPPPYVSASLSGDTALGIPPLPLNIVMHVVGSRGDVQPFIALGKVLRTYGHRIRLATHPNFKDFVEEHGLEFFSIGGNPSQLMAFMVKNPSLMPGFRSVVSGDVRARRKDVAEYIQGCWRSCYQTGNGMIDCEPSESDSRPELTPKPFVADCIIANPPSFAHVHCAEKLGIPLHIMFTMPYSPTEAFPHPLANIQSSNADPQLTNYISYAMIEILSWQGLGDIINRFRAKCLALDPISLAWAPGMLHRLKIPHSYCWSPALIPKPKDWGSHISISGFSVLEIPDYTPTPELQAFLDAGPAPVYVGFGSIVVDDPDAMTKLVFKVARMTRQRILLSKGWGGIGADRLQFHTPSNVFILGNVPHDWLFKRVSCVVHHGGAGTTAAGITAGRPSVIVPFFGDQAFWGAMVARAGAGPDPIPHKQLTAERLADAINFCSEPETRQRAEELASRIAAERGSETAAQSFHQRLNIERLRCVLAPSRAATWRIKGTKIRLSAFAACTLANENLLDFSELKIYRPQEYETDEGPWDPISGGFVAACGAFSSMAMGVADFPTETYKALQLPFKYRHAQSQASLSLQSEASKTSEDQTPQTSPEPKDCSHTQSVEADGSRPRKDPDMLRPGGPHTSKGLGRIFKSLMQSPAEISMGLTKGCRNVPKLWGDDTVRPQPKITDFASGTKAVGKEFGLGWYDGITGLVTQPWNGAQKEGATGLVKGMGKGVAGFIAHPLAGTVGILGYTLKGVQKEVQKLFRGNVQDHIIASRTTQGYEEWLQSSDAEKQDVIVRWNLIQKYLKKKGNIDEIIGDVLESHRVASSPDRSAGQSPEIARDP